MVMKKLGELEKDTKNLVYLKNIELSKVLINQQLDILIIYKRRHS